MRKKKKKGILSSIGSAFSMDGKRGKRMKNLFLVGGRTRKRRRR